MTIAFLQNYAIENYDATFIIIFDATWLFQTATVVETKIENETAVRETGFTEQDLTSTEQSVNAPDKPLEIIEGSVFILSQLHFCYVLFSNTFECFRDLKITLVSLCRKGRRTVNR